MLHLDCRHLSWDGHTVSPLAVPGSGAADSPTMVSETIWNNGKRWKVRNGKDRTLFQMSFFIQFFHYLEIISWEWERPPPCWGGGGETRLQTVPPTSCRRGRPARGGSMSCTSPPPPSWRGSHQPARPNIPRGQVVSLNTIHNQKPGKYS